MDAPGAYVWGHYVQRLSSREIAKMKKNMKKVPVIQLKSEIYHNKEINDAESILEHIDTIKTDTSTQQLETHHKQHTGFMAKLHTLRQRFISLF